MAISCFGGCTDVQLYASDRPPPQPDRLALSGEVCTDNPAQRSFPLKVLFMVDASACAATLDPNNFRVARLREAVNAILSPSRPNRYVGVVSYGGNTRNLTNGFTTDGSLAQAAVDQTGLVDPCVNGCRDLTDALSLANSIVTGDLLQNLTAGERSRTRYILVNMASGPPDYPGAACCGFNDLQVQVEDLRAFAVEQGVADLTLHSIYLHDSQMQCSYGTLSWDQATNWSEATMRQLAESGQGQYLRFDDPADVLPQINPPNLNYQALNLESLESPFQIRSFIVSNVNVRPNPSVEDLPTSEELIELQDAAKAAEAGGVAMPQNVDPCSRPLASWIDSDGDGLSDQVECDLGTDPILADTDADELGDRVELILQPTGLDVFTVDDPPVCVDLDPTADGDSDGLKDCEEALLGTDPSLVDTDSDGVPDLLEFLWGTDYLISDESGDLDQDGMGNGQELAIHSDPRTNDPRVRSEYSYQYTSNSNGIAPVPYFEDLVAMTGVDPIQASAATRGGVGLIRYVAGPPVQLSWQDPGDTGPGTPVTVAEDSRVVLQAQSSVPDTVQERSIEVDVTLANLPGGDLSEDVRLGWVEQECATFRVTNIMLRETLATPRHAAGINNIFAYFSEVPAENPLSVPLYRVALVQATFIQQPFFRDVSDEEVLRDDEFLLLGQ